MLMELHCHFEEQKHAVNNYQRELIGLKLSVAKIGIMRHRTRKKYVLVLSGWIKGMDLCL